MKEEKMSILKMLDEGKITADEAVKLMEAVSAGGDKTFAMMKEKLSSFASNAKPVVKKAAGVAKEVTGAAADAAKKSVDIIGTKITEIKNRPRKADFEGDVVVEPTHNEGNEPEDITDKVEIVEEKVGEAVKSAEDKAEEIAKEAKGKAQKAAKTAEDMAEEIAKEAKDKAEELKKKAEEASESVKEKAEDTLNKVKEKTEKASE